MMSWTASLAVLPVPIRVAEAKPVQSPYPSRCRRGSSAERVPMVLGTPFSRLRPREARWFRAGRKPVHQMIATTLWM
ncbi:hypothetical protein BJF77_18195 [Kocuria sp. CNJ-770]|nr:hypothetical protein BJF77_18195 [Kocuria sp. CNJ-770]